MNLTFQFASAAEFFNMGGYAFYVWLSYGVGAIVLAALVVNSARKRKTVLKNIAKQQVREERLRQHRSKAA